MRYATEKKSTYDRCGELALQFYPSVGVFNKQKGQDYAAAGSECAVICCLFGRGKSRVVPCSGREPLVRRGSPVG